mmetsp:Transcript_65971/g.127300  ORF Transcript_65971/g.127300 Transcript_65971/m.127300 type:complete len:86 (+) Transcript_65971:972-1229(+)
MPRRVRILHAAIPQHVDAARCPARKALCCGQQQRCGDVHKRTIDYARCLAGSAFRASSFVLSTCPPSAYSGTARVSPQRLDAART